MSLQRPFHFLILLTLAVAGGGAPALASPSCKLLNSEQFESLVRRSEDSLSELRALVDDELVLAVVTVAPEFRKKTKALSEEGFRFRDAALGVRLTDSKEVYRVRREVMALQALLPVGDRYGSPLAEASAKVRASVRKFIDVSTPFIVNDNCRFDHAVAARDASKLKSSGHAGEAPLGCTDLGPVASPCADLAKSVISVGEVCEDHDQGGSCSVELPTAAVSAPARLDPALATGGLCVDQPAYAASGSGRPLSSGGSVEGASGAGGASSALPR